MPETTRRADAGNLVALAELGHRRLPAGETDVRDWEVIGADGGRIGRVTDLLGEQESRRVRFLVVDLDDELAEARAATLPAGVDELLAAERGLEAAHLAAREWPAIKGDTLLGDVNSAGTAPPAPPAESRGFREIEVAPAAGPRPPEMGLDRARAADDLAERVRRVLLPARSLRFDPRARQVVVPTLSTSAAAALPAYRPGEPLPPALLRLARDPREEQIEREVEGGEERFYARPDPLFAAPLPPEPGTTPAELEATDAAELEPAAPDDEPPLS